MTHGSLFSGIGGFDLAAEWMGWENMFHCDVKPFAIRTLKYYWPNAKLYNDIKKTDFTIHRGKVDVLTGGFPCQPFSGAGKRKGKEDDRHLWPEMLRAIREIQPSWIVGENVYGLINWNRGMVFNEVQVDLENEGYEVQPYILPACSINAPHRRDRVWFVAHSNSFRQRREQSEANGRQKCNEERFKVRSIVTSTGKESITSDTTAMDSTAASAKMKSTQIKEGSMHSMTLSRYVMLPTVMGSVKNNTNRKSKGYGVGLLEAITNQNGEIFQLSPQFTLEMMGFPPNWTEFPFVNGLKEPLMEQETQ